MRSLVEAITTSRAVLLRLSAGVTNQANGIEATVGGGFANQAYGDYATVGGGYFNQANGFYATVGGGINSQANGIEATVGGGVANHANGDDATVGGGAVNTAMGNAATVPGGRSNLAQGDNSFAAGRRAKANQPGAFVWADSSDVDFASTGNNQFLIRANGGVGINTNSPVANTLTVNGQIIAGGITATSAEPFTSEGASSGISMDDRNGIDTRWVIFPAGGLLKFWKDGDVKVTIDGSSGKLSANYGFNGQCLNAGSFNGSGGNACNMDVAESFGSTALTEAGDLVVLSPDSSATPTVRKSAHAYEGLLVGVVSTNPGLVFDNGATHLAGDNSQLIASDKTVVALIGRVPVKVVLENGLIAVGDPLTSSSQPGIAMKATQPGKIIGYALESKNEPGKVLALVQPGYFLPSGELDARQQTTDLKTQNAELKQELSTLAARMAAREQQNVTTEARLAAIEQTLQNGNAPTLANTLTFSPAWLVVAGITLIGMLLARRFGSGGKP